jgi:hypothetical protein
MSSPKLSRCLVILDTCLLAFCCTSARAAQMEGPTVYQVTSSEAVISDDGSLAYCVEESAILQLDLKQRTVARINLDEAVTNKEISLAGFAPNGDLIGYSKANLWEFNPVHRAAKVIFTSPPEAKIRYATVKPKSRAILVSLAQQDEPDDSTDETLRLSVHDLVTLTWRGNDVQQEHTHTRREVLPVGAVFDVNDSLFFPMRDVYRCEMNGNELSGSRCLPLSTEIVFTGGGSPGSFGARSIAVSNKWIYVYVDRLGGSSSNGLIVRFRKDNDGGGEHETANTAYQSAVTRYSRALASMEVVQGKSADGYKMLCASTNGRHVLWWGTKWHLIDDDGKPSLLSFKDASP